ncbi:MAG TPA: hypothetical protein VMJ73_01620 [Rhizomicrobium sp.]|nr:hypothetical protein [Rhizomicrobium sp.]
MKLATLAAVATCCIALAGCADQALKDAKSSCESFGFMAGTDSYTRCVQQDAAMREASIGRVAFVTPIGPRAPGILMSTVDYSSLGVPVLYATYISGGNRVCMYNQADYDVDTTVPADSSCPRTLQ